MSARDQLVSHPILFFCCCAVVGYLLFPTFKEWVGPKPGPYGSAYPDNHSGVKIFDPFGFIKSRQSGGDLEPVPGSERRYREIPAPGGIGWNGHQRFFGIDDSGPRPPRRHYRDGGEGGWR